MKKEIGKLITFGKGGHTIHGTNFTCSGYEDPESFCKPYHWWAHPADQVSYHYDRIPEGKRVPVVDMREAVETTEGFRWAVKGPLVDVDLKDDDIKYLGNVDPIFKSAMAFENQFGTLLALQEITEKPGPLDKVSIKEYLQGWKDHGAKIGYCEVTDKVCIITWL